MSDALDRRYPPDDFTDMDRQPRSDNWESRRERAILKHGLSKEEVADIAEMYWKTNFTVKEIAECFTVPFGEVALIAGYTVQPNAYCCRCNRYLRNYKRSDRGSIICHICKNAGYTNEVHVEYLTRSVVIGLQRMLYRNYLKSDHWQNVRSEMLAVRGRKCQMCGATDVKLDVHHNTYRNRGKERTHELLVLCAECHTDHHDRLKKRKQVKAAEGLE